MSSSLSRATRNSAKAVILPLIRLYISAMNARIVATPATAIVTMLSTDGTVPACNAAVTTLTVTHNVTETAATTTAPHFRAINDPSFGPAGLCIGSLSGAPHHDKPQQVRKGTLARDNA